MEYMMKFIFILGPILAICMISLWVILIIAIFSILTGCAPHKTTFVSAEIPKMQQASKPVLEIEELTAESASENIIKAYVLSLNRVITYANNEQTEINAEESI